VRVLIFGATGMVGQGVLRECLNDPGIERVVAISRTPIAQHASVGAAFGRPPSSGGSWRPKLEQLIHPDLCDLSPIESKLSGFDACFFSIGVTSAGMSEEEYTRKTYDMTMSVARTLARLNPDMTFVYVSGAGTDSTERGRTMWARVKGRTENELLRLPFKAAYMFRPAGIQPMHGIKSKTKSYRVLYSLTRPLLPVFVRLFPKYMTTTEQVGRAMINVARRGAPKAVLESQDINDQ